MRYDYELFATALRDSVGRIVSGESPERFE